MTWRASGVVTLTTDFGLQGPYVGIMKGVLLGRAPAARCVDLTHDVPPQDVRACAWHLAQAWRWFPPGTVHVAVVDPGVGSERRILVAEDEGHAFLAPDNGLLGPVLGPRAFVGTLDVAAFSLPGASHTFHGRDVFAPAAAALASGCAPQEAGAPTEDWARIEFPAPLLVEGRIETEVLLVDRFGNLITGYAPDASLAGWQATLAGRTVPVLRTYSEVAPGEALALVDSHGHVEVAVRDGDAAREFGLGPGAAVTLMRRTT